MCIIMISIYSMNTDQGWKFFYTQHAKQYTQVYTSLEARKYLNELFNKNSLDFYAFTLFLGSFYKNISRLSVTELNQYEIKYNQGMQTVTSETIILLHERYSTTKDVMFV
jgi:hypothetical protein